MASWSFLLNFRFTSFALSAWSKTMSAGDSPSMRAVSRIFCASSMELQVYIVASSAMSFCNNQRRVHWLILSRLPGDEGVMKNMCPTGVKIGYLARFVDKQKCLFFIFLLYDKLVTDLSTENRQVVFCGREIATFWVCFRTSANSILFQKYSKIASP